jgi:hypothetical protein
VLGQVLRQVPGQVLRQVPGQVLRPACPHVQVHVLGQGLVQRQGQVQGQGQGPGPVLVLRQVWAQ